MFDADQMVEEGGLALVGEFISMAEANEYALVVLAMNLDCWMRMDAERQTFQLFAGPAFAVAIHEEFGLYEAEREQPVAPVEPPLFKSGIELALLWAALLGWIFLQQGMDFSITERFCNSSLAVFQGGEWWRPFTSLFLHGSAQHLIGNVLLGGIFCVFVAHSVGPWLGWLLILLSGTLGNILTIAVHYPEPFTSLGASTATFGALGIVTGVGSFLAWRSRSIRKLGAAILPITAGGIVLGWWGAGGPGIDVLGHLMGFAAGVVLGVLAAAYRLRSDALPLQDAPA